MSRLASGKISVSDGRPAQRKTDNHVKKLWKCWCDATQRQDEINSDVEEAFYEWLGQGYSFEELAEITRNAAWLRPVKNDEHDVRRLLRALSDESVENEAAQLSADPWREPYSYAPFHRKLLMSRGDLAEILCDDEDSWIDNDEEKSAALWIVTRMTVGEVEQLRDDIESAGYWDGSMIPSEFLAFKRARKWREDIGSCETTANVNEATDAYSQGHSEATALQSLNAVADPAAEAIYNRTGSARQALKYHEKAPAGYWDAVMNVMLEDEDAPVEKAYDDLEEEFDWHPYDREG